ncbi:phytanoyl-CoA dioxygenase family protein [Membranihabitans marinus]|uniref:phytanoyl-CoA dioxygenase family protein n=1 Tax=Membranihabitans marinus TaxID=1227546 RepID=UPI001F4589C7|nr:phytanoyl-CoA dioxygenase family protein [Membranihabitans marinus]
MNANQLFIDKRLTVEQIEFYNENGYLHLGKTLTDTGLAKMISECMDAWKKEKEDYNEEKNWLQNALLVDIHKKSKIVRDFYFEGPIPDVMTQVIGPNIKAATSQLTFKMRGNTKSFAWHQDNGYGELDPYNTISSLTALEDVDEENGCLRIIPGSHKQGQIDVSQLFKKDRKEQTVTIDLEVDESEAIPIPMKAGETIFFHCWTLHQSRGNFSKSRDRRILFMRYADANAVEVYNNRQPRLGKLLKGSTEFEEVANFEKDI